MLAKLISPIIVLLAAVAASATARSAQLDTVAIEQASGLKGTFNAEENVFKLAKPRSDVKIAVDGWTMPSFMGLGSWAAFTPDHDGHVMMMGDTVLFEDEVNPVMSAALDAGLEVTALHNHFFFDQPKVYYMHIGGTGDASTLASGVKKIYETIDAIRGANPTPGQSFHGTIGTANSISAAPLEGILGKGQTSQGMFKAVIGKPAKMHGLTVGKEMGLNTWAAFAGSEDEAIVDGDFAMTSSELQPVLKSMRHDGINIVALHSHMSEEQPRILFLHYWGKGKAVELAQAVKHALDAQAAVR